MKRRAALAAAITCLAVPAAAAAHLPRAHSTLIVPGQSMGGVRLDMTKAQVFGKWGSTTNCPGSNCIWEGPGKVGHREVALVDFARNGRVDLISIRSATRNNGAFKPAVLSNWTTKKGIHLGSPKGKVPIAYPRARPNRSTGVGGYDLFQGAGTNMTNTRFGTPGVGPSANLLWGISISWSCRPGPCRPLP
jgi:hypothetical protein